MLALDSAKIFFAMCGFIKFNLVEPHALDETELMIPNNLVFSDVGTVAGKVHVTSLTHKKYKDFIKWSLENNVLNQISLIGTERIKRDKYYFLMVPNKHWSLYSTWANKSVIEPHSQEEAAAFSSQNVTFMDETQGFQGGASVPRDPVRTSTNINDAHLGNFLSRPVLLNNIVLNPGAGLNLDINVWQEFFADPNVRARITSYKLIQCSLHLKFVINGSPFHYGRILVSYMPMAGFDELTTSSAFEAELVCLSQRPHIFLDPTDSMGGSMVLPFMWHKNAIDITSPTDFLDMGRITLRTLAPVKHANGATDPVTISVYAWAEDVQLTLPTNVLPFAAQNANVVPHAEEYATGPISRPSSVVANIASKLTEIPGIGPFAKATQLGASALSGIASLFGLSRPVILETQILRPVPKNGLAVINMDDDCQKLSLDAKQELSIDPRLFGMTDKDEMAISTIAQHESYLGNFTFPLTATAEDILWNAVVDPMVVRQNTDATGTRLFMPAVAFAAAPFKKWRGSLKYRFQIVCSKYHRGRLKIVYDPEGVDDINNTADYNTAYTTVVDIRNTTDFTFEVGWGQATTYRDMNPILNPEGINISTDSLPYRASIDEYGNGVIAVYCVTELAVPNSTTNNDIQINVFVSAGDDFEVAQPNGEVISNLRLSSSDNPANPQINALKKAFPLKRSIIEPHAMEDETGAAQDSQENVPTEQTPTITKAPTLPITDATNLVHFGESIRSFRQLLKRYSAHQNIPYSRIVPVTGAGNKIYHYIQRQMLPFEPGFTTQTAGADSEPYVTLAGNYVNGWMTPLRYLTTAFVGWRGGVRWMVDASGFSCGCTTLHSLTRYDPCSNAYLTLTTSDVPGSSTEVFTSATFLKDCTGQEGSMIMSTNVNPTLSVEVPYYSNYRFAPGRRRARFDTSSDPWMPSFKYKAFGSYEYNSQSGNDTQQFRNTPWSSNYITYAAAGEDFQVSGFVGAPPFYYEASRPT